MWNTSSERKRAAGDESVGVFTRAVDAYVAAASRKSDRDRTADVKPVVLEVNGARRQAGPR